MIGDKKYWSLGSRNGGQYTVYQDFVLNCMIIFTVQSILDKKVRLTPTQWNHTIFRHKELKGQEEKLKETLQKPEIVLYSDIDDNYQYYRLYSTTPVSEKYLLVVVKHLNGEGFIITAFFLREIRKKGKVKVYEK